MLAAECDQLKERLASVARGEAFLLQGGDCAETFAGTTAETIRGKFRTLLQMAVVLTYAASVPVVKVGRMAGQFGKPRSAVTEVRDGVELPSYRGDAVNGLDVHRRGPDARPAPPARRVSLLVGHAERVPRLRRRRVRRPAPGPRLEPGLRGRSPAGQRYERLAEEIDRAIAFMHACGADPEEFRAVEFYSSHEALLLDYERALTRTDARSGQAYASSAHLLWIGERTRDPGGAHVEFARQIRNPVAVKIGPAVTAQDVLALIKALDPDARAGPPHPDHPDGRGPDPPGPAAAGRGGGGQRDHVVWVCDPMHGNTVETASGHKTRYFDDVLDEVAGFFEVHRALGTHPGGIHIEFTGDDVTECIGGGQHIAEADLR